MHKDLLPPRDAIQTAFERFHEANPLIYTVIVRIARREKRIQVTRRYQTVRGSMAEIFETLRKTGYGKLDNDFRSRYARLVMAQEPDLNGFFEVRGLRAQMAPEAVIEIRGSWVKGSDGSRGRYREGSGVSTPTLTDREKQALSMIAAGNSSKEVADLLDISKRTVDVHLANIYDKLQVNNRVQAYNKARRLGLIEAVL